MSSPLLKQTTVKVVSKAVGKQIAKKVGTAVVGRFLGRYVVPTIGIALTAYDYLKYVVIPMAQGAHDYNEENIKSGDWMANLPH
jgi:hypothetical protein